MASSEAELLHETATSTKDEVAFGLNNAQNPIQNSLLNPNTSLVETQAEQEEQDELDQSSEHDGPSIIDISISAEQTRLASPSTPAAEKAAAIGDDPFAVALRRQAQTNRRPIPREEALFRSYQSSSFRNETAFDTPGTRKQGATSAYPQSDQHRRPNNSVASSLKNVVSGRPRASTGPRSSSPERHQRKLFPITFPKWPGSNRLSLPTVESALSFLRHPISSSENLDSNNRYDDQRLKDEDLSESPYASERATRNGFSEDRPPLLRRSTSDGSLYLMRAQSQASSLGDDSRFENIHEQLNSRAKAIRDSIVDANFRLPRLKSPWPDFHLSSKSGALDASIGRNTETRDFGHTSVRAGDLIRSRGNATERLSVSQRGSNRPGISPLSQLSRALSKLTGDIVILGGYRGSILRDADTHRQVWVPIKVGLGVRKVNLEVGLEPEDEIDMPQNIYPGGMLRNIGPVDISKRLFKRLMESKNARNGTLRVYDYGYDWRLSPELLSRQLQRFLEGLPSNQDVESGSRKGPMVIAHSLGGLIARHAINAALKADKDIVSGIIYAGVPQTCVNILGPLRNGDDVFLSSKVLTAQVNFTIRTSYALLPLDGACFLDKESKEEYRVDFFDPKNWEEYRLSPCIARPLPPKAGNEEPRGMMDTLFQSVVNVLPPVSLLRGSVSDRESRASQEADGGESEQVGAVSSSIGQDPLEGKMEGSRNPQEYGGNEETAISTTVTIKKEDAMKYLTRTLQEVKRFKEDLAFNETFADRYPPAAVIYGKSIPTVSGALVRGREGIKHADAYNKLAFGSGDGVVLARAAQLPDGYHAVRGGVVSSDRGHISLLGDIEAIGESLIAVMSEQRRRRRDCAVKHWADNYENQ